MVEYCEKRTVCLTRVLLVLCMQANEEQWKLWKQEGHEKKQLNHALELSQAAATTTTNNNDVVAIDGDEAHTSPASSARQARSATSSFGAATTAGVRRPAKAADKMSIQRALRAATARAALSRLDVAAQTADVVSAFEQEAQAKETTTTEAGDDENTDTDDEAVEATTTVYCDACNKARILSIDEAELADVSADNWTCANVSFSKNQFLGFLPVFLVSRLTNFKFLCRCVAGEDPSRRKLRGCGR